jgi:hypothetical protein
MRGSKWSWKCRRGKVRILSTARKNCSPYFKGVAGYKAGGALLVYATFVKSSLNDTGIHSHVELNARNPDGSVFCKILLDDLSFTKYVPQVVHNSQCICFT